MVLDIYHLKIQFKMKPVLFTVFTFVLLFTSCQTEPCGYSKTRFIKSLDKLVEKVSEADRKISDKAWKKDDEKFQQLVVDCYETHRDDMSMGESRDFWIDAIRYLVNRYGWSIIAELQDPNTQNEIIGVVRKNAMDAMDGIDDIIQVIEDEFLNNTKLKNLFDDLKNRANEMGQ